jgi:hypothetical protein
MRYALYVLLLLTSCLVAPAQELIISEELNARTFEILKSDEMRMDANGIPCALVKVQLPIENVVFEGNIIDSEFKTNIGYTYSGACPFTFSGDIRSLFGDSDIHQEERASRGIRAGRLALAAVAIR